MTTKTKKEEKTFEQQAKEYADCAIGNIREMVEALEHADECDGEIECDTCAGSGKLSTDYENLKAGDDCPDCKGAGTVTCTEGKDSDDPESWHDADRAKERIEEDALSIEVRSDWHTPGDGEATDTEYCILITTGGPAARIVGELNQYHEPTSAAFEYQDWFKPWTEVSTDSADDAVMLKYAQQFYFGE